MNCSLRYEYDEQVNKEQNQKTKTGKLGRWGAAVFLTVILPIFAANSIASGLSRPFAQAPIDTPKQNWEHMSGNDGKFGEEHRMTAFTTVWKALV